MSGLGSFIQGAFQGYSFGENVKDKKTARKRADEDYEYKREARDWSREDRDYTVGRREKNDAWLDESRDYTRGQRSRAAIAAERKSSAAARERGVLEAAHKHATETWEDGRAPLLPKIADTDKKTSGFGPDTVTGGQGSDALIAANRTPMATAPQGVDQTQKTKALSPSAYNWAPDNPARDDYVELTPDGAGPDQGSDQRSVMGPPMPSAPSRALGMPPVAGMTPPGQDAAPDRPSIMPPSQMARPDPSSLVSSPDHMPDVDHQSGQLASAGPAVQNSQKTVAPDKGGAPAIRIAESTAPKPEQRGVLGKDDPVRVTTEQRERAATSFVDHYAQTAVPKIVEYYLSTGDIKKAEAYEAWARGRESQGLMRSWAKATHAASIGDDDGFLDNMRDLYNGVDDGYEVLEKGTEFIRDDGGNILGANLSIRNIQTGEVFDRRMEGQQDLLEMGIYTFSPEQIFEHMWGQMEAAQKIDAENRAFQEKLALERVKKGAGSQQDLIESVEKAKKFLSETNFGTWGQLSIEEQNRVALEYIRSNQDAAATLSRGVMPEPYLGR